MLAHIEIKINFGGLGYKKSLFLYSSCGDRIIDILPGLTIIVAAYNINQRFINALHVYR